MAGQGADAKARIPPSTNNEGNMGPQERQHESSKNQGP